MPSIELREVAGSDLDQALDLADIVFHQRPDSQARRRHRKLLLRADRIGAYDSGRLVGFMACVPFQLSVPGAELPCDGVTFVCVLPTHRRRGLLRSMLTRLWQTRPLAALWASEGGIYGRFGFGIATTAHRVEVDTDRPIGLRVEPDPRPIRWLDLDEAPAVIAPVYARIARAGKIARDRNWWRERVLADQDEDESELTAPRVVALGAEGDCVGYTVYRTRPEDDSADRPGVVELIELEADTVAGQAALWRYLASIDLTQQIHTWSRPVDDALPLLLTDPDQARVTRQWGALWLRLVAVREALEQRSWAAPVDVVIDVDDRQIPENHGRWRLVADHGRATVSRTSAEPDLEISVADLASAYLGDVPIARMVRAGLVTENSPGAAARLDTALAVTPAPFATDHF